MSNGVSDQTGLTWKKTQLQTTLDNFERLFFPIRNLLINAKPKCSDPSTLLQMPQHRE